MVLALAPAVLLASATRAPGAPPDDPPGDPLVLERSGDARATDARESYLEADALWRDIARQREALGDTELASKAREARAALAALRLDTGAFSSLAVSGARPRPVAVPPDRARRPDRATFREVRRILSRAVRRHVLAPESEERDSPLIAEALALLHSVEGDLAQAEADALYSRALRRTVRSRSGDPASVAREARLRYKLRDFAGAWSAHSRLRVADLEGEARCAALRIAFSIALFLEKKEAADRLRADIREGCPKEEQVARPVGRLGSLLVASRADLVAVANFFASLARDFPLEPREAALAAYFAAAAALELGELAFAEDVLRGRIAAAGDDAWLEASMLARRARARDGLGDYESALADLARARSLAATLDRTGSFPLRLVLLEGRTFLALGKPERAMLSAREVLRAKALPAALRIDGRLLAGAALYEMARERPERWKDAREAFLAAERAITELSEKERAGMLEAEITASINIANVLRREALGASDGNAARLAREEAIRRQDRAMRRAYEAELHALSAVAASNLGELYLESGDVEEATKLVEWALGRAEEKGQFETIWRCYWYRGRIALLEGDGAGADRHFEKAMEIVESYRTRMLDAEAKRGFMADKMDLFRFLVRREIERGRPERALEIAERSRARSLVESLGWRYVALASPRETRLYREYIDLVAREATLREGGSLALFGVAAEPADRQELRRRLEEARARLLSSASAASPLHALLGGGAATGPEMRRSLDERAALIEYFDLGDRLVAFVVDREGVKAVPLDAAHEDLRQPVARFVASSASDAGLAKRLHGILLAPLEAELSRRRIVIVPHGVLHALPFEALQGPQGLELARREVVYLPSASLLEFLSRRRETAAEERNGLALVAFADPHTDYDGDGAPDKQALSGARREVAALAGSFPEPTVLEGESATESAIRRPGRGAGVLHIACHGEFYAARPWHSTLFLAPDGNLPERDGLLHAYEVYGLDLRNRRLVALSGCETGVSEVAGGDDPQGIATAFLHAGAPALLVSLWKVEDRATARLMGAFYRKWIDEKKDRAAALREAKLEMLDGGFAHPRQWASFVLVGEG